MGQHFQDIFGPGSNIENRIIREFDTLSLRVEACRALGLKIVLTSGTFDLLHVGHSRYLEQARQYGDILIVGVDGDEKVRRKKGPNRPIVHEDERMEIVCHTRHVDLVFLKSATHEHWQFIGTVRPDVLIATKETYTGAELDELKKICGEVVVLEPQAMTSTTARIRALLIGPIKEVRERFTAAAQDIYAFLDTLTGSL
ncbi:MAG: adenylyltransferase/cytidyltransferase family protein [Candidatus Kerfeldbacteria bacterium]|nr:adenylyltransferase/cytidyltransferase family protein [Candidatus Kerfeldbacteria bacterium]